ncbi:MAG: hypothetical protein KDD44_15235 [Bdellovibrionales bacterium]|nr:hypothetical protein [Bdellovibrionales bacterium]
MSLTPNSEIRRQFISIASELSIQFPDLDLRFNLQSGSNRLRYVAAAVSTEVHEMTLGEIETRELIYEAIFTLKELAQMYDA